MSGNEWNKPGCTLTNRGIGSSHGIMTCWSTSISTSFKKWFRAPSMSFNVCKSCKTTFGYNGVDGCVKESWWEEGCFVTSLAIQFLSCRGHLQLTVYTMQLIAIQLQLYQNNMFSIIMQFHYNYTHDVMLMSLIVIHLLKYDI
jgi:hypothetical protein